ncbi:MAG: TonB-dependent receptor [Deltaproteobacteria bacterium]|nr:MAG: TonB-dependent receptor [Deltaproteobacteria bacterium]
MSWCMRWILGVLIVVAGFGLEKQAWAGGEHGPNDGHGHKKASKEKKHSVPSNKKSKGKTSGKQAEKDDGMDLGEEEDPHDVDPVVVTGTRTKRRVSDTPVKTEVVSAKRIQAKGARNLIEALAFEPGVRLDNQCSVCNTTGLRLSGLPGRYLLVMVDGLPVYSSLGLTYGLLQIDTMDIKQIEIVKGANSVLYGTDAISGVVNIITRLPKKGGEGSASFEYGSFGSLRLAGHAGFRKGPFSMGTTVSYTAHDRVDRDGDQVSEFTGFKRFNASMVMRYQFSTNTNLLVRGSFLQENRQGGASSGSILEILSDFNPDADPTTGGTFGRRGLSETIFTTRFGGGLRLEHKAGKWVNLVTSLTALNHKQDSDYEGDIYVGDQTMFFVQQAVQVNILNKALLQTGITYRYEGLVENRALSEYQYHLPGVYAQIEWLAVRWLELVGGFRYDYHNTFGHVPTPRLAFKIAPLKGLTFRGVWGTGFRAPSTFYEYAHGARPQGYKLVNDAKSPERSMSANVSVTYTPGSWLSLTLEGAWNRIQDPITFEVSEKSEGQLRVGDVRVFNSEGELQVFSLEAQVQSNPLPWLQLSAGYGFYEYINQDVLVSAAPRHHITFGFDLRIPKVNTRISLTGEVFLPMDLTSVYGEGYNIQGKASLERWLNPANANTNSSKLAMSPTYGLINIRIEQDLASLLKFAKIKAPANVSLYFGIDNLLDFHQNDVEGPIFFPKGADGTPGPANIVYIWGPMRGRFVYAGIKVTTM